MKRELFKQLVEWIASTFGMSDPSDMFTKTRRTEIVSARHVLFYMGSQRGMKINEMMRYCTSEYGFPIKYPAVRNGIEVMKKRVNEDDDYKVLLNRINKAISFEVQEP